VDYPYLWLRYWTVGEPGDETVAEYWVTGPGGRGELRLMHNGVLVKTTAADSPRHASLLQARWKAEWLQGTTPEEES
jgi:hypothetical protein